MTRLGVVVSQLGYGGAERQTFELVSRIGEHGFSPEVFCLSASTDPYGDRLVEAGIPPRVIPRTMSVDVFRAGRLASRLRRARIEAVLGVHYEASAYAVAAARLGRIRPVIASVRTTGLRARGLKRGLFRASLRAADAVVVNSRAGGEYLVEALAVDAARVHLIPNGVDLGRVRPARPREEVERELGLPSGAPVVGYVGKDSSKKNVPLFLRAARQLLRERENLQAVLVGADLDGAEGRRLRPEPEDGGRVRFLGSREDIFDVMGAFDVLALTSREEGTPNVILEAMALGVPVVCTDVGDCRNMIGGGEAGEVVPSGDLEGLVRSIGGLLDDSERRRRVGAQGQARVREGFAMESMVTSTVDLLRATLGARAGR